MECEPSVDYLEKGRTEISIDDVVYKFKIGGDARVNQDYASINGIIVIKDGFLTEEGRRYLK